jgi:transposase
MDRQGRAMKPGTMAWTAEGLAALYQLASPIEEEPEELWRGELFEELQCLVFIEERLGRVERKLNQITRSNASVALLQTIPGVGPRLAEALVAAIDDPHRFASRQEVSSYFGLVPRMFESGQMKRHGRISKEGNSLVRKLLIEVSWLGLRYNPWMRELFCRICAGNKSRKGVAIVAVARRLAVRAWAMLRDNSRWQMPECVSSEKEKVTAA